MARQRLTESLDIDRVSTAEMVDIIQHQDRTVAEAVARARDPIVRAIDAIAERMASGGRLFYVGAGTSGRLAMLDAAELPPTYGIEPDRVQVLMAGGEQAFFRAAEGAEDETEHAIRQLEAVANPGDAVVGVAASGSTPYTLAAVRCANAMHCLTVGLTTTPGSTLAEIARIPIVVDTGPEVVMGSTRMKAGTAQKLVLNTLSTGVMVRLGRVHSNLMIEMPATNEKLRRRAVTMVELAADVEHTVALDALERCGGEVKTAVVVARLGVDPSEARARLADVGGRLREIVDA